MGAAPGDERIGLGDGILDHLDTGIAVFDPDGRLRAANTAARRFARLQGVDLDHDDLARVLRAAEPGFGIDDEPLQAHQSVILAAAEGREAERTVWAGPVDRRRALRKSSHRMSSPTAPDAGTVLLTRDVSRRAHHERLPHDFLAATSHELRNPLTPIVGHLELLSDDLDDADVQTSARLDILRRNVDRVVARLDELLLLEQLTPRVVMAPCDLSLVVRGVVGERSADAAGRRIRILVDAPPTVPVVADAARVRMALDSIVGNAVKFAPSGSAVTVVVSLDDQSGSVEIVVVDEGPGFLPAELTHVFEPFHRGGHARANAIPGLGLGLAVARGIAHAHGGSIDIVSEPGAGAAVRLSLPGGV